MMACEQCDEDNKTAAYFCVHCELHLCTGCEEAIEILMMVE
jgi:hypothetical protein